LRHSLVAIVAARHRNQIVRPWLRKKAYGRNVVPSHHLFRLRPAAEITNLRFHQSHGALNRTLTKAENDSLSEPINQSGPAMLEHDRAARGRARLVPTEHRHAGLFPRHYYERQLNERPAETGNAS
jgi:hypothetical protein